MSSSMSVADLAKPGKAKLPSGVLRYASSPTFAAQPECIATQAPWGISPLAETQASMSSASTMALASSAALPVMSTMQSGHIRFSGSSSATEAPSGAKCSGASIWVPVCS